MEWGFRTKSGPLGTQTNLNRDVSCMWNECRERGRNSIRILLVHEISVPIFSISWTPSLTPSWNGRGGLTRVVWTGQNIESTSTMGNGRPFWELGNMANQYYENPKDHQKKIYPRKHELVLLSVEFKRITHNFKMRCSSLPWMLSTQRINTKSKSKSFPRSVRHTDIGKVATFGLVRELLHPAGGRSREDVEAE